MQLCQSTCPEHAENAQAAKGLRVGIERIALLCKGVAHKAVGAGQHLEPLHVHLRVKGEDSKET